MPAGGAVVFSSLTPHLTGPNTTDAVRKAYIVQYAVAGIATVQGDWLGGGDPTGRTPATTPTASSPCCAAASPRDLEC